MTTDRTNRFPGQANDNSLVPASDERTFRVNTDQATGVSESTIESTLKTLRGTGIGAVKESVTDHFVLKGQNYRKVECLSDSSGPDISCGE